MYNSIIVYTLYMCVGVWVYRSVGGRVWGVGMGWYVDGGNVNIMEYIL